MLKSLSITFISFVLFILTLYYIIDFKLFYSIGFSLLLLVHELGHIIALKKLGFKIKGTYFIPFLGAVVVSKDKFKTRDHYAYFKYMGPLVGSLGVLITILAFIYTKDERFINLAFLGAIVNLINLIPITLLDGYGMLIGVNKKIEWLGILMLFILGFFIFEIYVFTFFFILIVAMYSEEGGDPFGFRMYEFIIGILCFIGIVITTYINKFDISEIVVGLLALYALISYFVQTKIKKIDPKDFEGNKSLTPLDKNQKIGWSLRWICLIFALSLFLYSFESLDFVSSFVN